MTDVVKKKLALIAETYVEIYPWYVGAIKDIHDEALNAEEGEGVDACKMFVIALDSFIFENKASCAAAAIEANYRPPDAASDKARIKVLEYDLKRMTAKWECTDKAVHYLMGKASNTGPLTARQWGYVQRLLTEPKEKEWT